MKAIVIIPSPEGGTLDLRDVPEPTPRPGEVLVRVRATALNRADLAQRQGNYPAQATAGGTSLAIAGLEAAGEVAGLGGRRGELDLELLARKRLQLIGVTFRTRTLEERIAVAQRFAADLLPELADGRLRPLIDRVFPLQQALEAQAYMASNAQLGKIVLTV